MENRNLWERLNLNSEKTESVIRNINQGHRTITDEEAEIYAVRGDDAIDRLIRKAFQSIDSGFISIDEIQDFSGYPFKQASDGELYELSKDIAENGMSTPVIVRRNRDLRYTYELIDGHRRIRALRMAGQDAAEAYIIECNDDMASLIMCENNLSSRRGFSTSELARVYDMELEALKRLHRKASKADKPVNVKLSENTTRALMAHRHGLSAVNLSRIIRINHLIPELGKAVDDKRIAFNAGVALTHLNEEEQQIVWKLLDSGCHISLKGANQLRKNAKSRLTPMNESEIRMLLSEPEKEAINTDEIICHDFNMEEEADGIRHGMRISRSTPSDNSMEAKRTADNVEERKYEIFMQACEAAWKRLVTIGEAPIDEIDVNDEKIKEIAERIVSSFTRTDKDIF